MVLAVGGGRTLFFLFLDSVKLNEKILLTYLHLYGSNEMLNVLRRPG